MQVEIEKRSSRKEKFMDIDDRACITLNKNNIFNYNLHLRCIKIFPRFLVVYEL